MLVGDHGGVVKRGVLEVGIVALGSCLRFGELTWGEEFTGWRASKLVFAKHDGMMDWNKAKKILLVIVKNLVALL